MRIGSIHDLFWENSFSVQAAVLEPVFTASFVIQSLCLDFLGWDMWQLWEKTGFWWETDHLEDLDIDGKNNINEY